MRLGLRAPVLAQLGPPHSGQPGQRPHPPPGAPGGAWAFSGSPFDARHLHGTGPCSAAWQPARPCWLDAHMHSAVCVALAHWAHCGDAGVRSYPPVAQVELESSTNRLSLWCGPLNNSTDRATIMLATTLQLLPQLQEPVPYLCLLQILQKP